MAGIAKQYALAVFSLAKEEKRCEDFLDSLKNFVNQTDEETLNFFRHPKISREIKKGTLDKAVSDNLVKNLLKVLIDNDRFDLISDISDAYQEILDEINQVMKVMVYSKEPLTKQNINKIKKRLNTDYQRIVEIVELKDETILGGFRLEFEGNVIDETINRKLDDLQSSLLD